MDTNRALLVRHGEAERLDTMDVTLYADYDMTGGKLSGNRAFLPAGTDGPPPYLTHAWAAPDDAAADVLVLFTPGIERFEYFRLVPRIRKGEADPAEILATQERFDNHFVDSPVWRQEFFASEVFRAE